jgi:predicted secreted protein
MHTEKTALIYGSAIPSASNMPVGNNSLRCQMKKNFGLILMSLIAHFVAAGSHAAEAPGHLDGTVIQADGEAQTRVQNDYLTIDLTLDKQDTDAARLNQDMQKIAAGALAKARKVTTVQAKTSGYSVVPVYDKSRIVRQQASYRITIETRDFDAGLSLAATMQPFQIGNLAFSVSPERRKETERALIQQAIAEMREKFNIAANSLGPRTVTVTHITIGARQYEPVRHMMMKGAMDAQAEAAMPAEAGDSQVTVMVSGSALAK